MSFTVRGTFLDDTGSLTWDDGQVTGDQPFLDRFTKRAETELDVGYVPGPQTSGVKEHLASPLSSYMLMCMVFDQVLEQTGDLPEFLTPPPGVIC